MAFHVGSFLALAAYAFLNVYWWFVNYDLASLEALNFAFLLLQIALFLFLAIVYLRATLLVGQIRSLLTHAENQYELRKQS